MIANMKTHLTALIALALISCAAAAQDWPQLGRYSDAAQALAARKVPCVIFMGDSITDGWMDHDGPFFYEHGFIGRGISGQTTPQMLLRFRNEVVRSGASAVVILAGTNDVAGNTGPMTLQMTVDNIASMCELALENGIRPIICSVLPAHRYGWRKEKRPDLLIPPLNKMLREYADSKKITYLDYFSAMVDSDPENVNGLPESLSPDGVHPNNDGYAIMEKMVLDVLKKEVRDYEKAAPGLRLMSFNVRNCKGMDDDTWYERPQAVISDFGPDAVAIQELDSATVRSEGAYILGELADRTCLKATYGPAIEYQGGKYGVGILSRKAPLSVRNVALPGREEARTLLIAEFDDYFFCSTHLSLVKDDRMASIEIIADAFRQIESKGKPMYLAGDWNDTPDSDFLAGMKKYFDIVSDTSGSTLLGEDPGYTIDYIATWKGNAANGRKLLDAGVLQTSIASDHKPIYCEFK